MDLPWDALILLHLDRNKERRKRKMFLSLKEQQSNQWATPIDTLGEVHYMHTIGYWRREKEPCIISIMHETSRFGTWMWVYTLSMHREVNLLNQLLPLYLVFFLFVSGFIYMGCIFIHRMMFIIYTRLCILVFL